MSLTIERPLGWPLSWHGRRWPLTPTIQVAEQDMLRLYHAIPKGVAEMERACGTSSLSAYRAREMLRTLEVWKLAELRDGQWCQRTPPIWLQEMQ